MEEVIGLENEIKIAKDYIFDRGNIVKTHVAVIGDLSLKPSRDILLYNKEIPIRVNDRFKVKEDTFLRFASSCKYLEAIVDKFSDLDHIARVIYSFNTKCQFNDKGYGCDAITCPRAKDSNIYLTEEEQIEKIKNLLEEEQSTLDEEIENVAKQKEILSLKYKLLLKDRNKIKDVYITFKTLISSDKAIPTETLDEAVKAK